MWTSEGNVVFAMLFPYDEKVASLKKWMLSTFQLYLENVCRVFKTLLYVWYLIITSYSEFVELAGPIRNYKGH